MCDYDDAYIAVNGTITVVGINANNRTDKRLPFNNNAPFISCISKIITTFIDNAEDLYILMVMYNLLEYSDNCSMTSGSLWNYYRDEMNDVNENNADNYGINNDKTTSQYIKI